MTKKEIKAIIKKQRDFFNTGATLDVKFRTRALKGLYREIKAREGQICDALAADLGKGRYEAYMCEIGMALSEIKYMIRHTARLSRPRRAKTPVAQFKSKSYMLPTPRGTVLIMSPWNYPILLTLDPLCEAVAAGNTVVLKPSAYAPEAARVICEIVRAVFDPAHVQVVTGGRGENTALLDEKFDFIFFTGSTSVGREVLRRAAETVTPAVLELGGKSPCIVDGSANIPLAARRIVFGKFLNCGQTCVAPDYILCQSSVKRELVENICREIHRQFGDYPLDNEDYGRIVNKKHYDRLVKLIDRDKLVYGGKCDPDALKISPTVLDKITDEDAVMGEEIFGPILPIMTFDSYDEVYERLLTHEKPLALYIFTSDKARADNLTRLLPFGGGCINDVIIHLATENMPFGGVGESGMGAYHGKFGFDTFSHVKSIVDKSTRIDLPMRYRPYKKFYEKIIRKFLG